MFLCECISMGFLRFLEISFFFPNLAQLSRRSFSKAHGQSSGRNEERINSLRMILRGPLIVVSKVLMGKRWVHSTVSRPSYFEFFNTRTTHDQIWDLYQRSESNRYRKLYIIGGKRPLCPHILQRITGNSKTTASRIYRIISKGS